MFWPATRSDCLRAIGHFLDQVGASRLQLEEGDTALEARYVARAGEVEVRYATATLETLLGEARARRGTGAVGAALGYEQRLRAIGAEMDRSRGRSVRIRQFDQSLVVSYLTREGSRLRSTYVPSLLESLSSIGPNHRREPAEVLTLPAVAPPGEGEAEGRAA